MFKKLTTLINKNRSILFVGIGNVLKHDDGAGVFLTRRIKECDKIKTLIVEQSIENYIGKINTLNPDILVLVDCLFFNKYPGFSDIIPVEELQCQTTNTHNISLKKISELFKMPVFVLGIEPENIKFGEGLTEMVDKIINEIADQINNARILVSEKYN
jgi:hydrogenase 3 maturation protease